MVTICLQIGNSDDKLSQGEWSKFLREIDFTLGYAELHFTGYSSPTAPWQNAAFIFNVSRGQADNLKEKIQQLRQKYNQDSVAWMEGKVEFV